MLKDTRKVKSQNLRHEKHNKSKGQKKNILANKVKEEIVIEITSNDIENILRDINIHAHVLGGLILRPATITIPLRKNKLQVGDKVILLGVEKNIARVLTQLSPFQNGHIDN
jgi:NhaP-type Na+/H+ and K+/H+ antiporter